MNLSDSKNNMEGERIMINLLNILSGYFIKALKEVLLIIVGLILLIAPIFIISLFTTNILLILGVGIFIGIILLLVYIEIITDIF
jgi:hypothetical protein